MGGFLACIRGYMTNVRGLPRGGGLPLGGGLPPGGSASREVCLQRGICFRGSVCIQRGWVDHPPPVCIWDTIGYGQQAGGTHSTGMHYC